VLEGFVSKCCMNFEGFVSTVTIEMKVAKYCCS